MERARVETFVRQSSGLVREFDLRDVAAINIVTLSPGLVIALYVIFLPLLWPGANTMMVVFLGAIVSLAVVLTYGLMSAAMPRSGGDYVFVGRTLWPWLGFTANWMITWSFFMILGLLGLIAISVVLSPGLAALGAILDNNALVDLATRVVSETPLLAVSSYAVLGLAVLLSFTSPRTVKLIFRILTSVGLAGLAILAVGLLATDRSQFVSSMNSLLQSHGTGTIEGMRAAAEAAGFQPVPFSWGATFAALPFGYLAYVGVSYTTYIGGEIQRPQRSQPLGMLLALAISLAIYLAFFGGMYRAFGWDNLHVWASLTATDPGSLAFPGGEVVGLFLFGTLRDSALLSLVSLITFLAWALSIPLAIISFGVRNLFAWSFDRVLPASIANVNSRGIPYVATVIVAVIALGVTTLALFTDLVDLLLNYTLMYSIPFFIAGIAAAVFPYRRPDLFERAPDVARIRILGVPLVTIAGVAEAAIFAYLIFQSIKTPALSGPISTGVFVFIGVLLLAAPVIFFINRAVRQRQGVNVDEAWRMLPPD